MIISASRRTDIPAFYAEWFMNRIREGYCTVPNPFNPKQISEVPLLPEDIEAVVFWSKNPEPIIRFVDELESLGYVYYFLFTLNDYPSSLEPELPDLERRLIAEHTPVCQGHPARIDDQRFTHSLDPEGIGHELGFIHEHGWISLCSRFTGHRRPVAINRRVEHEKLDISRLPGLLQRTQPWRLVLQIGITVRLHNNDHRTLIPVIAQLMEPAFVIEQREISHPDRFRQRDAGK